MSSSTTIAWASWRWRPVTGLLAMVALAWVAATAGPPSISSTSASSSAGTTLRAAPGIVAPSVLELARTNPGQPVTVIVQLHAGADRTAVAAALASRGAAVTRDVPLIRALAVEATAARAALLGGVEGVRAVSIDAPVEKTGGIVDVSRLASAYNQSLRTDYAWSQGYTGKGIGVAVLDTGVQGDLVDFKGADGSSRVIANAVVNPEATNALDTFGHGTHIAGLVAGNGAQRATTDPLYSRYAGTAPDANVIAIKADDGHGRTTVLDVIDGIQFAVDKKDALGIRILNLSLSSTIAESYKTDPLDAAVEAAWFSGIVVVAAAGNRGGASDAVHYAPANDPFVITIGGVDDKGTKAITDDQLATWSSRGTTQDGFAKPDVLAPGARLVSTIPAGSDYTSLCPSCLTDGEYFRVGGTSMAAAVASGAIATILQKHPNWTPDQVKAAIVRRARAVENAVATDGVVVDAQGNPAPIGTTATSEIVGAEIAVDKVLRAYETTAPPSANQGIAISTWLDPTTKGIDYSRTSWTRTSWTDAVESMRTSWTRTSWTRTSWTRTSWTASEANCVELERTSWTRTSWTRTSWTAEDMDSAKAQCDALLASIDPTRTSWTAADSDYTRTSWTRTSWTRTSWTRTSWTSEFDK